MSAICQGKEGPEGNKRGPTLCLSPHFYIMPTAMKTSPRSLILAALGVAAVTGRKWHQEHACCSIKVGSKLPGLIKSGCAA